MRRSDVAINLLIHNDEVTHVIFSVVYFCNIHVKELMRKIVKSNRDKMRLGNDNIYN